MRIFAEYGGPSMSHESSVISGPFLPQDLPYRPYPEAMFEVCSTCLCTVTPRAEFNPNSTLLQHPGPDGDETGLGRSAPLAYY